MNYVCEFLIFCNYLNKSHIHFFSNKIHALNSFKGTKNKFYISIHLLYFNHGDINFIYENKKIELRNMSFDE